MMVPRELAPALWRQAASRPLVRRLPAGSGGTGRCEHRRFAGRLALGRMAARHARLLRQQAEVLRVEFQAVIGPVDGAAVREAAQALQDLPLETLVERAEGLLHRLRGRVADWATCGGLLEHVHGRLVPVLSPGAVLEPVRQLARLKEAGGR